MVEVSWTKSARSDLENLDAPVRKRVLKKITWFAENFEYMTPQPLSANLRDFYKLRAGDYRVIYDLAEDEKVVIRMVGHRKDIYE